jgi:nucleoside-diphosphate-sugar epimerase
MKVLVTGASGFVGSILCDKLAESGYEIVACSRSDKNESKHDFIRSPELGPEADWSHALYNVHAVVHLAGLAHVASSVKTDPEAERLYHRINTEGSRKLAEQCAESGVKQYVFLSSCHAIAAESSEKLCAESNPNPVSAYGRSKLEAERSIVKVLTNTACAYTILRPPIVYGNVNKANFGLLLKLVKRGIPLPLAWVSNRRSFIYVENLVDVIVACLGNPKAFGKTYLPSDGKDVSTPELIRMIANAIQSVRFPELSDRSAGRSKPFARHLPLLYPFPESILKGLGQLAGFSSLRKLTSSLYVESETVSEDLGWAPRFTMEEGLKKTLLRHRSKP